MNALQTIQIQNRRELLAMAAESALRHPGTVVGYFAPSSDILNTSLALELKQFFCDYDWVIAKYSGMERRLQFGNGSSVLFYALDSQCPTWIGTNFTDIFIDGAMPALELRSRIELRSRTRLPGKENVLYHYDWASRRNPYLPAEYAAKLLQMYVVDDLEPK